jgi:hypothetical protein
MGTAEIHGHGCRIVRAIAKIGLIFFRARIDLWKGLFSRSVSIEATIPAAGTKMAKPL